jgi:hypothetical protein
MKFNREWAMPNANTFEIPCIADFIERYRQDSIYSIDPFARNRKLCTHTNDLNPSTNAEHHMDATAFLRMMALQGTKCDFAIFDPPYSPRQISEVYAQIGSE